MPKAVRLAILVAAAIVIGSGLAVTANELASYPPTVAATPGASGEANLTIETVGTIGFGAHPTWVSYLIRNSAGKWVHSTVWQLPAHSLIHVTVLQYDSAGPLRNELWGEVNGTTTGAIVADGKPTSLSDANGSNAPAHTFTVPELGLNVPMIGVPSSATNICAAAPCDPQTDAHVTITFDFRTGAAGNYRWQCFVPCGLGFLDGNGGPMQNLGYMGGYLRVVNA